MLKDVVAKKLVSIWMGAYVQCSSDEYVTDLIEKYILKEIKYVTKYRKDILQNDQKKTALLKKWGKVFDIARCTCFLDKLVKDCNYKNCGCAEHKKLVNFETYIDQITNKSKIVICEEDKLKFQAIFSDNE